MAKQDEQEDRVVFMFGRGLRGNGISRHFIIPRKSDCGKGPFEGSPLGHGLTPGLAPPSVIGYFSQ